MSVCTSSNSEGEPSTDADTDTGDNEAQDGLSHAISEDENTCADDVATPENQHEAPPPTRKPAPARRTTEPPP